MTTNEIVDDFQMSFKTRKFAAGLPLALNYLIGMTRFWFTLDCCQNEWDNRLKRNLEGR